MRKLLVLLLGSSLLFNACDRVKNPIPIDSANYDVSLFPGNYATEYNYPSFGTNSNRAVNKYKSRNAKDIQK
jgi:hypothetical protein